MKLTVQWTETERRRFSGVIEVDEAELTEWLAEGSTVTSATLVEFLTAGRDPDEWHREVKDVTSRGSETVELDLLSAEPAPS